MDSQPDFSAFEEFPQSANPRRDFGEFQRVKRIMEDPLPDGGNAIKTVSSALPDGRKGHSYKPVPKQFRHDGFSYRQVAREGDLAIYEQRWRDSENLCFEVVRIRRHDGFTIAGNKVEPAEFYPKSASWGIDGFTLTDKDAAFSKLK